MASYAGMKYNCLRTNYEGHVGNRNPILGIGHVAYDEDNFDVEGRRGPGTRGDKRAAQVAQNMRDRELRDGKIRRQYGRTTSAQKSAPDRWNDPSNAGSIGNSHGVPHSPPSEPDASSLGHVSDEDQTRYAGGEVEGSSPRKHMSLFQDRGKKRIMRATRRIVAPNTNLSMRKPTHRAPEVTFRTAADKYFGGSTHSDHNPDFNVKARSKLNHNSLRASERGLLRASQEYGKNPITGEGHLSWDDT